MEVGEDQGDGGQSFTLKHRERQRLVSGTGQELVAQSVTPKCKNCGIQRPTETSLVMHLPIMHLFIILRNLLVQHFLVVVYFLFFHCSPPCEAYPVGVWDESV